MAHIIYEHLSYRSFLKTFLEIKKEQGVSQRAIIKRGKIGSPGYLKAVIEGERRLTNASAEKVAAALGLEGNERDYLYAMVRLEHGSDAEKDKALIELRKLLIKSKEVEVPSEDFFSHWVNGVVFSLATIEGIEFTAENLYRKLGGIARVEEIQGSMDFLLSRKWIVYDEASKQYKQSLVKFDVLNDVRRINLQRAHRQYLDLAKHRINDDLDQREYQGLTIAIPMDRLPYLKQRVRSFVTEIHEEINGMSAFDTLVRLQCCVFKLTR
ncbi:MAG: TIGR02147 family protein [Oligoflexales bacterium]